MTRPAKPRRSGPSGQHTTPGVLVRAPAAEIAAWRDAAADRGVTLTAWLRGAAADAVRLDPPKGARHRGAAMSRGALLDSLCGDYDYFAVIAAMETMRRSGLLTRAESELLEQAGFWAWALGEFLARVCAAPPGTDPPCPRAATHGWVADDDGTNMCEDDECPACGHWNVAEFAVDQMRPPTKRRKAPQP